MSEDVQDILSSLSFKLTLKALIGDWKLGRVGEREKLHRLYLFPNHTNERVCVCACMCARTHTHTHTHSSSGSPPASFAYEGV